ncbi:MAG: hypothetical protein HRF49_03085 [bacterium]|jgi:hypothetical protein
MGPEMKHAGSLENGLKSLVDKGISAAFIETGLGKMLISHQGILVVLAELNKAMDCGLDKFSSAPFRPITSTWA